MTFASLGLSAPLITAVTNQGYKIPSPIQSQSIPAILEGRDILAAAQTGTGKTAGFTLPTLELLAKGQRARHNQVRALILTPTRELAAQVAESVKVYGADLPLSSAVVFGGVKINPQMQRLRSGADILVATPGRLLDLYNQNALHFKQLEILVLDEADRMLDMGFIHDIRKIIQLLPAKRQTLMFSATFSKEIRDLAGSLVKSPVEISVTPRNSTATTVEQWIHPVDKQQKPALLKHLINEQQWQQVLVFGRTKHGADRLARILDKGNIKATAIHGNKSQNQRTRALDAFKKGKVQVLVATDIAARGLDIDQLPQVVNFDLPKVAEDYVHRIGRTGRAGATGQAISLVCADEFKELAAIERLIGRELTRELVDGFEPGHDVPVSDLSKAPKKPKKPKQPKANNPQQAASDGNRNGNQTSRRKPKPRNANAQAQAQPGTEKSDASKKPAGKAAVWKRRTIVKNKPAQGAGSNTGNSGNSNSNNNPTRNKRRRRPSRSASQKAEG